MTYRMQTMLITFAYLFLNSIMFGTIFSRPLDREFLLFGLGCGMIALLLAIYLLFIVYKTDPK